ncbi:T5orf172 domain-containing protein [Paraburkholderia sp. BL8N3]|nr:GIY-YIG nuclease family protein [Paraburkholderia sp. BL8N3]TCK33397.1 T5orf172 domain-containing protein [Paraburkholderia sp. BL8N3]
MTQYTRDPAARAAELSSATGVPTPFTVAYEAYFDDCDEAEAYVHAALEAKGLRVAPNREFFAITSTEAINAVVMAQAALGRPSGSASAIGAETSQRVNTDHRGVVGSDPGDEPWRGPFDEAERFYYGRGDTVMDIKRSIVQYKLAARLGSGEAYLMLYQAHSELDTPHDRRAAIEWLKEGGDRGFIDCWLELASVYDGDDRINAENAVKCFRKYFEAVMPEDADPEGSRIFAKFKQYLEASKYCRSSRDDEVIQAFSTRFRCCLSTIPHTRERDAKLAQLDQLLNPSQNKTTLPSTPRGETKPKSFWRSLFQL